MTVSSTTNRMDYTGNGVASTFAFTFRIFAETDLRVTMLHVATGVETTLAWPADFTVTGVNDPAGGSITLVDGALGANYKLTVRFDADPLQDTDVRNQGKFYPEIHEDVFDFLTLLIQSARDDIRRSLRLSETSEVDGQLPAPEAGKVIGWNSGGTGLDNFDPASLAVVTAYGDWIEDEFTGDGTTTVFTLSESPGSTNSAFVIVGATLQGGSDYSIGGASLTFVTAPPSGSPIRVKYGNTLAVGTAMASQVAFTQTGGVLRSVEDKLLEYITLGDFGGLANGTTDDTAALQQAIDATPSGGVLDLSDGVIKFSSVTIAQPITIRGRGRSGTYLRSASATLDGIVITTPLAVNLEDFSMDASVTRTAGAAIKVNPASSFNGNSSFKRVNILNAFVGIDFVDASDFTLDDCYFGSYLSKAVMVQNTDTPDAGDSAILNSAFDGAAGAVGIHQFSSGGLRIQGNKLLGGAYHYLGEFNSGVSSTSILLLQGNSSENASAANFAFNSTNSTGFAKVQIQNNQLSVAAAATGITISDPGYDYLDIVTIDGNQVALGAGALGLNAGRAARLDLGPNGWFGQGATITAVSLGSAMGVSRIAPQTILNCATEYAGTYTLAEFNPPRVEGAQQAGVTCSTVYGSNYASAATAVTFARPFAKAPVVEANAMASGGGLAVLINSVTTSGFTYTAISVTNGGSVPIVWSAKG